MQLVKPITWNSTARANPFSNTKVPNIHSSALLINKEASRRQTQTVKIINCLPDAVQHSRRTSYVHSSCYRLGCIATWAFQHFIWNQPVHYRNIHLPEFSVMLQRFNFHSITASSSSLSVMCTCMYSYLVNASTIG